MRWVPPQFGDLGRQRIVLRHVLIRRACRSTYAWKGLFYKPFSDYFTGAGHSAQIDELFSGDERRHHTIGVVRRQCRAPCTPPIDPLEQHRQFRPRHRHRARRRSTIKSSADCPDVPGTQKGGRHTGRRPAAFAPAPPAHQSHVAGPSRRTPARSARPAAARSSTRRQYFPQHRGIDNAAHPHATPIQVDLDRSLRRRHVHTHLCELRLRRRRCCRRA